MSGMMMTIMIAWKKEDVLWNKNFQSADGQDVDNVNLRVFVTHRKLEGVSFYIESISIILKTYPLSIRRSILKIKFYHNEGSADERSAFEKLILCTFLAVPDSQCTMMFRRQNLWLCSWLVDIIFLTLSLQFIIFINYGKIFFHFPLDLCFSFSYFPSVSAKRRVIM